MASPIRIKRSAVLLKRPGISDLQLGELALNTYDGKLFTKQDTNGVGIGTTITLLTPWQETYGGSSVYYEGDVGIGDINPTSKLSVDGGAYVSGNLGVGTTNPSQKLHVVGNIAIGRTDNATTNSIRSVMDVNSWEYATDNSNPPSGLTLNLGSQDASPQDLFFKSDGTKVFVIGSVGDNVYEYALGTAWDITTGSYTTSYDVSGQELTPYGIYFKPDGTRMYISGGSGVSPTGDYIRSYTLDSAWDLSGTVTYDNLRWNMGSSYDTEPQGLYIKPDDGLELYVCGSTNDKVYQFTLGTAWDVSSASFTAEYSLLSSYPSITGPTSIDFDSTGTKMYISGGTREVVARFTLSTAWDVSTATFYDNIYIGFTEQGITGLFIEDSQNLAFICGTSGLNPSGDRIRYFRTNVPSLELSSASSSTKSSVIVNNQLRLNDKLYVTDDIDTNGDLRVKGTINATTINVTTALDLADSDILRFGSSDDVKVFYDGSNNDLEIELEAAATQIAITDNGTYRHIITKDGKVGINTSVTPTATLDVNGTVKATLFSGSGASLTNIPNGALDNSTVSYGGVQLSLGGSDATPAFNLQDATNYPYASLTGKPTIGDGTLTLEVSGVGLSGSQSFTANQTGNATFTVTSNATDSNTANTVVSRNSSGDFSANSVTLAGQLNGPAEFIIDPAAVGDNTGAVRIKGDLYVDGTTTQINSTTLEIADFVVGIASTATTDLLADGAGIQIGPDNTLLYDHSNTALKSSENFNIASDKTYKIDGTDVLSSTTLGIGVTISNIRSVNSGLIADREQTSATNNDYILFYDVSDGSLKKDTIGSASLQGIQGPSVQGSQGTQGITGTGTPGSPGPAGSPGEPGSPGPSVQGSQGTQGIQGTDGTQGIQGITGTGSPGPAGSPGEPGSPGPSVQGSQGTQGIQGTDGTQGIQGITGTGTPGSPGPTGAPGPSVQGSQGTQGIQGIDGLSGARDYTVTNIGSNAYTIDGSNNPSLNLLRGFTYTFSISASGHPFYIQTSYGSYNSNNVYSTGVTGNGTQSGTITFEVPYNAPSTLYYVCQHHSSMNGTISVSDVGPQGTDGTQGTQGIQGITGTGTPGSPGPTGAPGPSVQGSQGTQGIQGETIQGVQGPSGGGGGGSSLTIQEVAGSGGSTTQHVTSVSTLKFDGNSGFNVTDEGSGEVFIDLGSNFNPWQLVADGGSVSGGTLTASGEEPVQFVAGNGISITSNPNSTPKQIKFVSSGGGGGGGSIAGIDTSNTSQFNNLNVTGISTLAFFTDDLLISKNKTLDENTTYYSIHKNLVLENDSVLTVGSGSTIIMDRFNNLDDVTANSVTCTGTITAGDFNSTSDIKLKQNVEIINDPLEKIMKIDGVSFHWKESGNRSLGVIAQNIEKILPELVTDGDTKTVNYNGLIGLLIECIKNQQHQINELKDLNINK